MRPTRAPTTPADYALTAGSAVFINNANSAGSPLPTPTPSLTPSITPTATPTPTPSTTPTPSLTPHRVVTPTVTPTLTPGGVILDVDDDGATMPLTDGLLILRYLFGFRGAALIGGAVGAGAERDTAPEIEAYLPTVLGALDIDGNGSVEPLTDGLLILRYLFGFRGATLDQRAVAPGAPRDTPAEIEAYIATLL